MIFYLSFLIAGVGNLRVKCNYNPRGKYAPPWDDDDGYGRVHSRRPRARQGLRGRAAPSSPCRDRNDPYLEKE